MTVGIQVCMSMIAGRRCRVAIIAGFEVVFLVVKEREAVHDIQRVPDVTPERQVKTGQWIPETLIPAESRDVRRIKVPLRLQRHVADKVVEKYVGTDVTVKQIVPDLGVHSRSTQFQPRCPDTNDSGGLGCTNTNHQASQSSLDKSGVRTPVQIRHTRCIVVSKFKSRRHTGTAAAVAIGLNEIVLNTQFHVRIGRVHTVDVHSERIGRTTLQLVDGCGVEHIDALLTVPQHIIVANCHKHIALMAIQNVDTASLIGSDTGIQQLHGRVVNSGDILTAPRDSTNLKRVVTQKLQTVSPVVQNVSIVDRDVNVRRHFISMLQIATFLQSIHTDVNTIAAIARHGGIVHLHHAATLVALIVQVVKVRAVVLSDHQAVAPVLIKRIARRHHATAEGRRNTLTQLHTVFSVAVVGGIYRVQVKVHATHSAIIRIRLVLNRY